MQERESGEDPARYQRRDPAGLGVASIAPTNVFDIERSSNHLVSKSCGECSYSLFDSSPPN